MKTILLIISSLCVFLINAQSTFQNTLFQSSNAISDVIYVNEHNTTGIILGNYTNNESSFGVGSITKFTTTTGNITSTKTFSITDVNLEIRNATKKNTSLYVAAAINDMGIESGAVLKYSLTTNSINWSKKIITNQDYIIQSITHDNGKYLYVLGSVYNSVNDNSDLAISKMDTSGLLIWTKIFGESTWDEYPSQIIYNGVRELYIASIGTTGLFGKPTIIRLDSAGNIINTLAIETSSGPRFSSLYSKASILDNKLVLVNGSIVGPSDVGPSLIRVLDSSLVVLSTKTISGLGVQGIYGTGTTFLLTGQAPIGSGFPGFRSIRYDASLNQLASRYYNKINTYSIANSAACFINSNNQSIHAFKVGGNDSLFIVKTDISESTNCRDSIFNPINASVSYSVIPYNYSVFSTTSSVVPAVVSVTNGTTTLSTLCSAVTSSVFENEVDSDVLLFPNPTSSLLEVYSKSFHVSKIIITNMLGKEELTSLSNHSVDLSKLSNGIYFVTVCDDFGKMRVTKKIIKY